MIHPSHQGDIQIGHVHNLALRNEISERLSIRMGQMPFPMPPQLMMLMGRLCGENSEPTQTMPLITGPFASKTLPAILR